MPRCDTIPSFSRVQDAPKVSSPDPQINPKIAQVNRTSGYCVRVQAYIFCVSWNVDVHESVKAKAFDISDVRWELGRMFLISIIDSERHLDTFAAKQLI